MNQSLAILLGLLYTDGCLTPKGKSSWRFYFSNKSEKLVMVFRDCMMQCFELPESRVRLGKTQEELYRALVDSKEIGNEMTRRFGTFRTLKKRGTHTSASLPVAELLRHGSANVFLQAAFSCDGGVNLYVARRTGKRGGTRWLIRSVYLACAHPRLRKDYTILLKRLGIQSRNIASDGKIKIEAEKDIRLFHKKVGFIQGVHITHTSRFWPNIEKQLLLEQLVRSYGRPRAVYQLPQFVR